MGLLPDAQKSASNRESAMMSQGSSASFSCVCPSLGYCSLPPFEVHSCGRIRKLRHNFCIQGKGGGGGGGGGRGARGNRGHKFHGHRRTCPAEPDPVILSTSAEICPSYSREGELVHEKPPIVARSAAGQATPERTELIGIQGAGNGRLDA